MTAMMLVLFPRCRIIVRCGIHLLSHCRVYVHFEIRKIFIILIWFLYYYRNKESIISLNIKSNHIYYAFNCVIIFVKRMFFLVLLLLPPVFLMVPNTRYKWVNKDWHMHFVMPNMSYERNAYPMMLIWLPWLYESISHSKWERNSRYRVTK